MSAGAQPAFAPWSPAPPQVAMAYSVCRGITRSSAKNFYYAFLVLPRHKREALCAVYSFMRRCDDITDDTQMSLPERRAKLDAWLDDLHRARASVRAGRRDPLALRGGELWQPQRQLPESP